MYCEISRIIKVRITLVPLALIRCGALTTSDISQYTLDNVFIVMPVRMRMTLVTIVMSK